MADLRWPPLAQVLTIVQSCTHAAVVITLLVTHREFVWLMGNGLELFLYVSVSNLEGKLSQSSLSIEGKLTVLVSYSGLASKSHRHIFKCFVLTC